MELGQPTARWLAQIDAAAARAAAGAGARINQKL
jgi:hypothetical protein